MKPEIEETIKEGVELLFNEMKEADLEDHKTKQKPSLSYYDNRLDEDYPFQGRYGIYNHKSDDELLGIDGDKR